MEGVQKAKELQPDLIALDIRLPSLDGIEAARHIRKLSRIQDTFVNQASSVNVVQEDVGTGAYGYVVRLMAALQDRIEARTDNLRVVHAQSWHKQLPIRSLTTGTLPANPTMATIA